jgi:hypothetical protein
MTTKSPVVFRNGCEGEGDAALDELGDGIAAI